MILFVLFRSLRRNSVSEAMAPVVGAAARMGVGRSFLKSAIGNRRVSGWRTVKQNLSSYMVVDSL